jgi:hypothetical protein
VWHQRTVNFGVVEKEQLNNYLVLGKDHIHCFHKYWGAIARTTPGTKFKISTCDTSDDNVKMFKSIAWFYGPCIAVFKHLRPVITIDARFFSYRYKGRLLMACEYDAENKLIHLVFEIVDSKNVNNWGWFM